MEQRQTPPIDKQTAPSYVWGRDCMCYVLEDTEGLSIKQEIMPPGTSECLHLHEHKGQFFFILEGAAHFFLEGQSYHLESQQGISVSPGQAHFIRNDTNAVLEFLVITQPNIPNDRTNL